MLNHCTGDIMEDRSQVLLTTVACDGTIGGGLELRIRQSHPALFEQFRATCRDGRFRPGSILAARATPRRWVIHLGIKDHLHIAAQASAWQRGLEKLSETLLAFDLTTVALARDGCGLKDLPNEAFHSPLVELSERDGLTINLYRTGARQRPGLINAKSSEPATSARVPEIIQFG